MPPAFSRDACPVCGAPALVDAKAADNVLVLMSPSPPRNDPGKTPYLCFNFTLTCRACRASFEVSDVERRYWPSTGEIAYILDDGKSRRQVSSLRGRELSFYTPKQLAWDAPDALARHQALEKLLWRRKQVTPAILETLTSGDWYPQKLDHWLRAALYYGKGALIAPLIAKGASLELALPWALANRQVEAAAALLEYGVDPNEKLPYAWVDDASWQTLLPHPRFEWAGLGKIALRRPLTLAIAYHAPQLVERLLEKGAEVALDGSLPIGSDKGDVDEFVRVTPWTLAILTGQDDLVTRFWHADDAASEDALYYALCAGRESLARRLLDAGAGLWQTPGLAPSQETALHAAARGGMDWVVDLWLAREPDIAHVQTERGITPLHLAARLLRPTTTRLLLARGADPNARGSQPCYRQSDLAPLHEVFNRLHREGLGDAATTEAALQTIAVLLDGGADPNLPWDRAVKVNAYPPWRQRPTTPLISALMLQSPALFDIVVRSGADVNRAPREGAKTPLIVALEMTIAGEDPHHFFEQLLASGADPRLGWQRGKPAQIAHEHKRHDLMRMLSQAMSQLSQ